MKKLISISVALALMVTFMAPVGVAAEDPTGFPHDPGAYSKTPFGILGSAIYMVGDIIVDLSAVLEGFIGDMIAPQDLAGVFYTVGDFTGVNLAWMTDMTGWSMVAVGDVLTVLAPIGTEIGFELDGYLVPVADVFYVLGARIFDDWDTILVEEMVDELPAPGIGLPENGYPR